MLYVYDNTHDEFHSHCSCSHISLINFIILFYVRLSARFVALSFHIVFSLYKSLIQTSFVHSSNANCPNSSKHSHSIDVVLCVFFSHSLRFDSKFKCRIINKSERKWRQKYTYAYLIWTIRASISICCWSFLVLLLMMSLHLPFFIINSSSSNHHQWP